MKKVFLLSLVAFMLSMLAPASSQAAVYTDGMLLKSPLHTSIYQYQDGTRRAFPTDMVFYTWHDNFLGVTEITVEEMEAIPLGNPMPIKPHTKLIKFPLNPKTYAVTGSEYIQHIPNPATAIANFGADWETNIIELPEIFSLFYTKGSALPYKELPKSTSSSELILSVPSTQKDHPYIAGTSLTSCALDPLLSQITRNVSLSTVLPEKYSFCFDSSWDVEIVNTDTNYLYLNVANKGTMFLDIGFALDYELSSDITSAANAREQELKNSSTALEVSHTIMSNGLHIIDYVDASPLYHARVIEVIDDVTWTQFQDISRVTFSFTGDYADYSSEIDAFKSHLDKTFSFAK